MASLLTTAARFDIVFTKAMIENAKNNYPQGQTSQKPNADLPWYPAVKDLNLVFSGENVKPANVDVINLSNVSAWDESHPPGSVFCTELGADDSG